MSMLKNLVAPQANKIICRRGYRILTSSASLPEFAIQVQALHSKQPPGDRTIGTASLTKSSYQACPFLDTGDKHSD